jgi:hypothetical protein
MSDGVGFRRSVLSHPRRAFSLAHSGNSKRRAAQSALMALSDQNENIQGVLLKEYVVQKDEIFEDRYAAAASGVLCRQARLKRVGK